LNTDGNKDLSKNLKAHHFSIAEYSKDPPKTDYTSMAKQTFDYKGDPSLIKGSMAKEVKDDLRNSHFQVGYGAASNFPQTSGRPMSAIQTNPPS
jgi:hypothetical protein